jgi:hypothetical protein
LTRAKQRAQAINCTNNLKQCGLAWLMYAGDNNDAYAYNLRNPPAQITPGGPLVGSWVNDNQSLPALETDPNYLISLPANAPPLLGPYIAKNPKIFKCPSDLRTQTIAGQKLPATRSYSMNGFFGAPPGDPLDATAYRVFRKTSNVPRPTDAFVFIEEAPWSINDGLLFFFAANDPANGGWSDCPGAYHIRDAGVSFADGHGVIHRWQGVVAQYGDKQSYTGYPFGANAADPDYQWLLANASVHK